MRVDDGESVRAARLAVSQFLNEALEAAHADLVAAEQQGASRNVVAGLEERLREQRDHRAAVLARHTVLTSDETADLVVRAGDFAAALPPTPDTPELRRRIELILTGLFLDGYPLGC